ncbi:6fc9ffb1-7ff3-4b34-b26d-bc0811670d0b-CDS [Sclerotinia trifoliorum]|uniref:6fc9ffb1-7ff3-4b34-b26d-bc0811670d0b-CDS n=1 Tax=Sclerotinia trifoliorum TaxID=28548 RepID=A0A8H2ZSK4_9HELO|nr:6fc9ffb1-7ff3-4b34-b26d-bc0811670d0b-CDS [Sclerotinia trifoliorum]
MEGFSPGTFGSSPFPSYKDPDIGINLSMDYGGTQSDDFDEDQRVIWILDPSNTLSSTAKNQLGHSDNIKMGKPDKDIAVERMVCLRLKWQDDDVRPLCTEWMPDGRARRDTAQ